MTRRGPFLEGAAMAEDPLENMRQRSEQCRRLSRITHDEKMKWQLLEWAHEIEADIQRLELERAERRR